MKLLTVKDLQDRLKVSRSMAWKLICSGEIPHVKIGR
jgi:excisionase family DNA binding protein